MKTNLKEQIIQKITGLSKEQLFLNSNSLNNEEKLIFDRYLERYKNWEPLEYIIERAEFYNLDFFVDKRVLIPRNDTEVMVQKSLDLVSDLKKSFTLIDVWTWSACIPISLIKNSINFDKAIAIDISEDALDVAKINIKKHDLWDKIDTIKSYLLDNLVFPKADNIIITANLPYIKSWDYENMDKSVIKYEPKIALYWWKKSWFELYEKLIKTILKLKENMQFYLFIEIGFDQKKLAEDFLNNLWLKYQIFNDNSEIPRCIQITF